MYFLDVYKIINVSLISKKHKTYSEIIFSVHSFVHDEVHHFLQKLDVLVHWDNISFGKKSGIRPQDNKLK